MNNSTAANQSNTNKPGFGYFLAFLLVAAAYGFYFYASHFSHAKKQSVQPISLTALPDYAPLNLDTVQFPIVLNNKSLLYRDDSQELTIHEIMELKHTKLMPIDAPNKLSLGVTNATIWLISRIKIESSSSKKKRLYIEITHPQLKSAEFFLVRGDGELYKIEGNKQHPKNHLGHYNDIFPLPFILEEEITIFVKFAAQNNIAIDLLLWDQNTFSTDVNAENFIVGLFYGSLILMGFYNFLIYLQTRDDSYLYFVLYVFFLCAFQLIQLGHGQLLGYWGERVFQLSVAPYFIWIASAFVILFTRSFLETKQKHKTVDYCLRSALFVILLQAFVGLFTNEHTTFYWLAYYVAIMYVFVFLVISTCYFAGNINAKFLLIGWIFSMTGALALALMYLQVIPTSSVLFRLPLITLSLGSALLSFSLSDRIKKNELAALKAKSNAIESLARYESTFKNAIEGIYTLSLNGDFLNANPSLVKMLEYKSEEELIKDSYNSSRLIYSDPDEAYERLAKHGHFQEETTLLKNNRPLWVIHSAMLSFDEDGIPSHIEGTLVNISDNKLKILAKQKKEREEIEKEEALYAAKAKSQFLANMSHELRTPLTAIIGYSEALIDEESAENRAEYLGIISRSGKHLTEVMNDVLDLSKVESQEIDINPSDINIYEILNDIESYFKMNAQEKGLHFNIHYQWPLPFTISADYTRTKQILLNLCSNALKFTEKGGIDITVEWLAKEQLLSIAVQDSGIGLSEDQLSRLFQSYTQAETSTARNFGGTGLGLVISKQFAEKMGGDISVTSEQGFGTCFTVTLGMSKDYSVTLAHNESEFTTTEQQNEEYSHLENDVSGNVLILDSDKNCQEILKLLLEHTALELCFANSAAHAQSILEDSNYDLFMIDIDNLSSDLESLKVSIKSRSLESTIALTADVINGHRSAAELDIKLLLEKPFSKIELYQRINDAISS